MWKKCVTRKTIQSNNGNMEERKDTARIATWQHNHSSQKGSRQNCKNYMGIVLVNTSHKILAQVIQQKLSKRAISENTNMDSGTDNRKS